MLDVMYGSLKSGVDVCLCYSIACVLTYINYMVVVIHYSTVHLIALNSFSLRSACTARTVVQSYS